MTLAADMINEIVENKAQNLNLKNKELSTEDIAQLAKLLEANTSVLNIDLSYNNLGNDGAKAIANVIKKNKSLRRLQLQGCFIGREGISSIAEALKSNTTLYQLNMSNNNIDVSSYEKILQSIANNKNSALVDCKFYSRHILFHSTHTLLSDGKHTQAVKEATIAVQATNLCVISPAYTSARDSANANKKRVEELLVKFSGDPNAITAEDVTEALERTPALGYILHTNRYTPLGVYSVLKAIKTAAQKYDIAFTKDREWQEIKADIWSERPGFHPEVDEHILSSIPDADKLPNMVVREKISDSAIGQTLMTQLHSSGLASIYLDLAYQLRVLEAADQPSSIESALVLSANAESSLRAMYSKALEVVEKQHSRSWLTTSINSAKQVAEEHLFLPKILRLRYEHCIGVLSEASRVASEHGISLDNIANYLKQESPELRACFIRLLKGSSDVADLAQLESYGRNAAISSTPEQLALLQFINHSIVPNADYFEIWASKVFDLKAQESEVRAALASSKFKERPLLEMMAEKPVALSGKRDLADIEFRDVAKKSGEAEALAQEKKRNTDAIKLVRSMLAELHSPAGGTIKDRHLAVKLKATEALNDFNGFFNGIEGALRAIDVRLDKARVDYHDAEFRWERAEAVATQLKLLALRDPKEIIKERMIGDAVGSAAAGVASKNPLTAISNFVSSQVRNFFAYRRMKAEHIIMMESAQKRSRLDVTKLEAELEQFEAEVKKLEKDKNFHAFINDADLTRNTRALFLLLPRIIAGENNIDAMELRAQKIGYADIDSFVVDLRKRSGARVATAMENYLFGLADSNDLRVIVAEANSIKHPQTPCEHVLVEYVEKVIKRHFPDQSRQASTIDSLVMHNVIPTRRPFHSFGEIVKTETDAGLKALLGGKGDFSLVGSNDVHDLFAYYQARHSDGNFFVDLHDKSKLAGKHVHTVASDEIETWRDQAIRTRSSESRIPRISSIFLEICTHEYLLAQGMNTVKNKGLGGAPQVLGSLEMVNEVTRTFIGKLALYKARAHVRDAAIEGGASEAKSSIGSQIEGLIARSFVDFYAELGARHAQDRHVGDRVRKVDTAFTGENFSLASTTYAETITENAQQNFELFLSVYQRNLEFYLTFATRENRQAILEQISSVKDVMSFIQVPDNLVLPDTEQARLRANYRNHSLSNVALTHSTWVDRSNAVVTGGDRAKK